MLCQRNGECDVFIDGLVGDERAIPDHVCPQVMRAACSKWFYHNSVVTAHGHSVAYIGDNLRVKGMLDPQRKLTDWPIQVDGPFDTGPYLAHVIRQWVLAPRGTEEDANKSRHLFFSQRNASKYMARLRPYMPLSNRYGNHGQSEFYRLLCESDFRHFSLTARSLAPLYDMPYDPATTRFAASEILRQAGVAVPDGISPSRSVLVTTFILVHDPVDIFADPQAHRILQRTEQMQDYATKELRQTADKVADRHAKWWREQYPVTPPRRDLRQFNQAQTADNDRTKDINAYLNGQINRQTLYAREIERRTKDQGRAPTETEIERLMGAIRTQISRAKRKS